jgi:hypothetical protein
MSHLALRMDVDWYFQLCRFSWDSDIQLTLLSPARCESECFIEYWAPTYKNITP